MFAKTIVLSDAFLDMPLSARCLYFTLGMEAMNKGLLKNTKSIARVIGCSENDVDILVKNGFLKEIGDEFFQYEITHWYENNGIGETAKKRNNYKYRKWRKDVILRDGCCQKCGSETNLVAHHIKSFSEYPLLRNELSNGVTLCEECHKKLHREEKNVSKESG